MQSTVFVYCETEITEDFVQGTSLDTSEQQIICMQPGMQAWQAAAAQLPSPSSHDWDVFISHAGNSADKPFARALKQILERTGWGLRIFLDDDSLVPGGDPNRSMLLAMETTQVAVILFSTEFFRRPATKSELKLLLERQRQRRAELLPVFLRLTVEECKGELSSYRQPGAAQV